MNEKDKITIPPISFEEFKANKEKLLPLFSEGFPPFVHILNSCIIYDIPTIACCKGHEEGDSPYIIFSYNDLTRKRINPFLNEIAKKYKTYIMFSTTGSNKSKFNVGVYANMENREQVFTDIASILMSGKEEDYLKPNISVALRLALNLGYQNTACNVTLFNKSLLRKYMIGIYEEMDEDNIFREYSKVEYEGLEETYYLYSKKSQLEHISYHLEKNNSKKGYAVGNFYLPSNASLEEKIDHIRIYQEELKKNNYRK